MVVRIFRTKNHPWGIELISWPTYLFYSLEKDGEYVAECLPFVSNDLESVFTHSILGGFTIEDFDLPVRNTQAHSVQEKTNIINYFPFWKIELENLE